MKSWATIVKTGPPPKPKPPAPFIMPHEMTAFAFSCGASWGDIDAYDPSDGDYKAFFLQSAKTRTRLRIQDCQEPSKEDRQKELDRFKEDIAKKEKLRQQAQLSDCLCGCGRKAHIAPRPDFAGYCCGWCKKHDGKRGHGDACGK